MRIERGGSSGWCWRGGALLVSLWMSIGCNAFDAGLLRHQAPAKAAKRALDAGMPPASNDAAPGLDADASAAPGDVKVARADAGQTGATRAVEETGAVDDAGGASCRPSSVDDYCQQMPELDAAPVIDGALDCGPKLLRVSPMAWNGKGAMPASFAAWLAVAYRKDGIYVYVEIRGGTPAPHPADQAIYCGDAIELYVDGDGALDAAGNYDSPGTMQFIIAAPTAASEAGVDAQRFVKGASQGVWRTDAVARALPDGYAVETFIRDVDLGLSTWSPNARAGIDLAIDVGGALGDPNLRCGRLLGQFFLRVGASNASCSGEPWCDSLAFCTPTLL